MSKTKAAKTRPNAIDEAQQRLDTLQGELASLRERYTDQHWKFIENSIYFMQVALTNAREASIGHLEASYLLLCSVLEGLGGRKYGGGHVPFDRWVQDTTNAVTIPSDQSREAYVESIRQDIGVYREVHGARRNFRRAIREKYEESQTIPGFLVSWDVQRSRGGGSAVLRSRDTSWEEALHELNRWTAEIYDDYRCPLSHDTRRLPFPALIAARVMRGRPSPFGTPPQAFALIVLDVFEHHIKRPPFLSDED